MSAYADDPRVQLRQHGEGWPPDVPAQIVPSSGDYDKSLIVLARPRGDFVVQRAIVDEYPGAQSGPFATLDDAIGAAIEELP